MSDPVRYAVADHVATITMDDPDVRNALTAEMLTGLRDAFDRAVTDDDVRCIVLASSHPKVWCAGGDLKGFASETALITKFHGFEAFVGLFKAITDCPKPTLAAINGHALAGGMGLAMCFDLILASEQASFGTPEINIGAFPFMIMAVIYRNVPRKRVNELLMLGDRITAQEAKELEFVNRVVPVDAFDATVAEWAGKLAAKSPLLMRMGKEAMARQRDLGLHDA
ncbi:MAG: enoyl-CoA hydratase/isomerase family protein, partial [Baekduiaceae bacterium]